MATMIKFRGIPLEYAGDIDGVEFDGTFVYGDYIKYGEDALIVGDVLEASEDGLLPSWWVSVDPKTVEQFTGLKDVNGKDIYEGDIIKSIPNGPLFELSKVGVVTRSRIDLKWCYESGNIEYNIWASGRYRTYEVIGNVHENPELLEADK